MDKKTEQNRIAAITRTTKETDISLTLNLDGSGQAEIDTGIGFFDHMLHGFARHGLFDLQVKVKGDLQVDTHHTIEDTGIVLGNAIRQAVGDKAGIVRYGFRILPMDEALILCALDLCNRPYLVYDLRLDRERVGDLETEMVREFFYAVAYGAAMNLHIKQMDGSNNHHIIEGTFKAFGKALDEATRRDGRILGVLSTKGSL
ncbi:MAG: imidazoleglycerol-phosphate dehydratase HisB [Lachnospiraceae bacterium]|nr:imidazoleglycerol-phosphate dehydratase HisB [Lachnospiraceae bacterium]